MTKEFVTYEQALALKELGFDEPCFGYYKHEELLIEGKYKNSDHGFSISAPTYSQAFRWFRERYDLGYSIKPYIEQFQRSYLACIYECLDNKQLIDKNRVQIRFSTYEEAESACLDKLIEICKNK